MRLIDADELTNEVIHDMAIAALHSNVKYFSIVNDIVVAFSKTIDNAPTIDAEPVKHGEWVKLEIKGIINPLTGGNRTYTGCSCCGEPIPTDSILDIIPEEEVNFCFGCGAKMKGQGK